MTQEPRTAHPNGHFYSPVCNPEDPVKDQARIWPPNPTPLGIDFNDASHAHILDEVFPRWMPSYDYPETLADDPAVGPTGFYTRNSQFSWLDSRTLHVLLREWHPKRIIEVGSGYSSLLMADVNRRHFGGATDISCIEPYPRPFLVRGIPGIARLVRQRVQDVPLSLYGQLEAGDLLFIDSSHVAKTGSDVNHLYFEVVPRLARGVRIHIHDIHLPHDYIKEWAITENRSWNEQYVVQALLMYSTAFKVSFGCAYAMHRFADKVRKALGHPKGHAYGGGSLWLERM